ncbi:MAG TPA: hypothetical protein VGK29_07580 [Paludibaculum sp.]|jgi:hypothetical protein
MRRLHFSLIALLTLAGCSTAPDRDPVLGEAYVGPSTLQIREELTARAELVAMVKHGEKVELIGRRRRFYRVRVAAGGEGWVDGRQLLSRADMDYLSRTAERAREAPTQGRASVFEALNVHTVPNRQAPSFFQITHDGQVDVIAHELAPRVPFDPPDFIQLSPVTQIVRKARKPKAPPPVEPPPLPKPPPVPSNWLELSHNPQGIIAEKKEPEDTPAPPNAIPLDPWTLVRAKDGRAGWVLTRMILMAIPDEIAQHAERAHISAYFSLGQTLDKGEAKTAWLWATLAKPGSDYEFDSMRIFVWSARRHRYETSYIERNLKGWLPIQVKKEGGFTVVVEEKDGRVVERTYGLTNYRARVVSRQPAQLPAPWAPAATTPTKNPKAPAVNDPAWQDKAKGIIDDLKGKLKR